MSPLVLSPWGVDHSSLVAICLLQLFNTYRYKEVICISSLNSFISRIPVLKGLKILSSRFAHNENLWFVFYFLRTYLFIQWTFFHYRTKHVGEQ